MRCGVAIYSRWPIIDVPKDCSRPWMINCRVDRSKVSLDHDSSPELFKA
jgi:hypothetical protein